MTGDGAGDRDLESFVPESDGPAFLVFKTVSGLTEISANRRAPAISSGAILLNIIKNNTIKELAFTLQCLDLTGLIT